MNETESRNAYVLTRVYNNYSSENFEEHFCKAVSSVVKNVQTYQRGKVTLILQDDSPEESKQVLLEWCGKCGMGTENVHYVRSKNPGNSALASFCVKDEFLRLTTGDEKAFAVLLDQDDELMPDALERIAMAMPQNGVVISPFTIIDEKGLDITGDGGVIQQQVISLIQEGRESTGGIGVVQGIWNASSIGWTKAYSRGALEIYQESLRDFLDKNRGGVEAFYGRHPAYEDFVDFYMLLRNDVKIAATTSATHIYYKHDDAITCNPDTDAFKFHRSASLLLLIDLCYANQSSLCADFEQKLMRYVVVKVVDVECILAKYRWDYEKGNENLAEFEENTYDGFFVDMLYRLSQGREKDVELLKLAAPVRTKMTKGNFNNLFRSTNAAAVYSDSIKDSDSLHVLKLIACYQANPELLKKGGKKSKEIPDKKRTPNQKRRNYLLIGLILIVVAGLIFVFTENRFLVYLKSHSEVLAVVAAFVTAAISFGFNEVSKAHILGQEEAAKKKLYYSEFDDLIRHLEANLKVMIEVRKQMTRGKKPANVHFINLSWPKTSCLFSDDISSVIDRKYVDEFAHIKVNLRNVENSSRWLSTFVREHDNHAEICKAIDWEISRHIGYLVNFSFFKDYKFRFPNQDELYAYVEKKEVKQDLARMFLSCISSAVMVEKYLGMYYDDRKVRRNVLVFNTGC